VTVLVVLESARTTDVALSAANASTIANAIRFMPPPTDRNALTGDSFLRVMRRVWERTAATPPEPSTRGNAWVETAFPSER